MNEIIYNIIGQSGSCVVHGLKKADRLYLTKFSSLIIKKIIPFQNIALCVVHAIEGHLLYIYTKFQVGVSISFLKVMSATSEDVV